MKTGIELITEERARQMSGEGYTAEHDDRHSNQELQRAAESYFLSADMLRQGFQSIRPPDMWPWEKEWWKPACQSRDLVKAGALWMAEIGRLKRLQNKLTETTNWGTIFHTLDNHIKECARRIDELLGNQRKQN